VSGRIVELAGLSGRKRISQSAYGHMHTALSSGTVWQFDIRLLDVTEKGKRESIPATTTSDGILEA
jgi:hypothetical protein